MEVYKKKKCLTPMITSAIEIHGDKRSPSLASFQSVHFHP